MKKLLKVLLVLLLAVGIVGCGNGDKAESASVLKVAATLDPHEKILKQAKPILLEKYNIDLQITTLDDYYIFNRSLNTGDVDANYFQHRPFFNDEIKKYNYDIVEAGAIHIEPFGFYSKTIKSVDDIKDGSKVLISDSIADNGRLLSILADANLITIKEGVNVLDAKISDIDVNTKNLQFQEIKPELLATAFKNGEGDLVAINGNYALQAGLTPTKDAVLLEKANADNPYVNIIACQKGKENDVKIKALVEVLKSDEIKKFIEETYQGSVIPVE